MSAAYVRGRYGVDYKQGDRLILDGKPGTLVSFPDQYLGVRLDGETRTSRWHPTWRVRREGTVCIRRPGSRWTICKCEDCRVHMAKITKLKRLGRLPRVPASAAWERLEMLLDAGFSTTWIASSMGIPPSALLNALALRNTTGRRGNFSAENSRKLVTGDVRNATAGRRDATGTRRRLQALALSGWTVEELGRRSGISFVTLAAFQRGESLRINPRIWNAVRSTYEELQSVPGPSRLATRRALDRGWFPSATWDDIETDPEPTYRRADIDTFDAAAVNRYMGGDRSIRLNRVDRLEALRRWQAAGRTIGDIERLTGWNCHRDLRDERSH